MTSTAVCQSCRLFEEKNKQKPESPDWKMTSENWQVPMKRVKSTGIKTRAGNRQIMCNNEFEAIAERNRDKKTKRDRSSKDSLETVDASTSSGGCEEERGETQFGSEGGSGNTEGRKKDPNFVGILSCSSVGCEPLCEMASEWTPMPQPLVVDSGVAEKSYRERGPQTKQQTRRVQARCIPHNGRRQHRAKRRGENADHVDSRQSTIEGRRLPKWQTSTRRSGRYQRW